MATVASDRRAEAEARIRAVMKQLLSGDVPKGFKCDVSSLSALANVPRATLYRTYPHLKAEFDQHLGRLREAGKEPDPHVAQVERLKSEVMGLRDRLSRANTVTAELEAFRHSALSRLAAQHEEITALRRDLEAARANCFGQFSRPHETGP